MVFSFVELCPAAITCRGKKIGLCWEYYWTGLVGYSTVKFSGKTFVTVAFAKDWFSVEEPRYISLLNPTRREMGIKFLTHFCSFITNP